MRFNNYLAGFSDDDVYTMLYLYHIKGKSMDAVMRRFSIKKEVLEGFLEGRYRKECYDSFKVVERML